MDNKNSIYKKCSLTVGQTEYREFEFLVPNHSVDENGYIDKEIIQEITNKFENKELIFEECEAHTYPSWGTKNVFLTPTITIEGDCRKISSDFSLPTLGEDK